MTRSSILLLIALFMALLNASEGRSQDVGVKSDTTAQAAEVSSQGGGFGNQVDPNSPAALALAMDIEFQIVSTRAELEQLRQSQNLSNLFLTGKSEVQRAFNDAKGIDCDKDNSKLAGDYDFVMKALSSYFQVTQDIQKFDNQNIPQVFGNFWIASSTDKCKILQNSSVSEGYEGVTSTLSNLVSKRKTEMENLQKKIAELSAKLRNLLVNQSAINSVTEKLPLIIAIIAGAAILIILVVRIFDVHLQMEWVASGQVIQFTTVMILLSALMALGLTGILHEQVLGTLLGGIAGYVLAQGVGRATARATLNAANAANSAVLTPLTSPTASIVVPAITPPVAGA